MSKFDIRYNNVQHQFKNSECGVYSINFVIRLAQGETFNDIVNNITKDVITNDEITPYGLISKNRIYNLDAVVASFTEEDEDIDDESKEE